MDINREPVSETPLSKSHGRVRGPVEGDIRYSPYKPPEGRIPDGTRWVPHEKHLGKGYIISWRLQSTVPEDPPPYEGTIVDIPKRKVNIEPEKVLIPPDQKLNLNKPKDVGIQPWQEED